MVLLLFIFKSIISDKYYSFSEPLLIHQSFCIIISKYKYYRKTHKYHKSRWCKNLYEVSKNWKLLQDVSMMLRVGVVMLWIFMLLPPGLANPGSDQAGRGGPSLVCRVDGTRTTATRTAEFVTKQDKALWEEYMGMIRFSAMYSWDDCPHHSKITKHFFNELFCLLNVSRNSVFLLLF